MAQCNKFALLVGCNYPYTDKELKGCQQDVLVMEKTLSTMFKFDLITVLINKPNSQMMPTGENIKHELKKMIDVAKAGDVLFFYFSGPATKIPNSEEVAIVPCDFKLITSVDLRDFAQSVPAGATFTIMADSDYSGGLLDKEADKGILLAGCQSNEERHELLPEQGGPCGEFSNAVQMVLKIRDNENLSNKQVVDGAIKVFREQNFTNQHPCLHCSCEKARAVFLCNHI